MTRTALKRTLLFGLALGALAGCTDDRSATDPGTAYHCAGQGDCLDGFTCLCGFCRAASTPPVACDGGADTAAADTTPADMAAPDVTPAETGSDSAADAKDSVADASADGDVGPCNPIDWTPCPVGAGCYYDFSVGSSHCMPHGQVGEGATCDPTLPTACGTASEGSQVRPLLCDVIDKKCYRTCNCAKPGLFPCPVKQTCYCLVNPDKSQWPDNAGICAP